MGSILKTAKFRFSAFLFFIVALWPDFTYAICNLQSDQTGAVIRWVELFGVFTLTTITLISFVVLLQYNRLHTKHFQFLNSIKSSVVGGLLASVNLVSSYAAFICIGVIFFAGGPFGDRFYYLSWMAVFDLGIIISYIALRSSQLNLKPVFIVIGVIFAALQIFAAFITLAQSLPIETCPGPDPSKFIGIFLPIALVGYCIFILIILFARGKRSVISGIPV